MARIVRPEDIAEIQLGIVRGDHITRRLTSIEDQLADIPADTGDELINLQTNYAWVTPPTVPPVKNGWTRTGVTKFDKGDAGLNNVAGELYEDQRGIYGDRIVFYPAHWMDNNKMSYYDYKRTATVRGGLFRVREHVATMRRKDADGNDTTDDPRGWPVSAAVTYLHPEYGQEIPPGNAVELCQRVLGSSPFGHVNFFWPSNPDDWSKGEMDYPEGGHNDRPQVFHHERGANPERNHFIWANGGAGNPPLFRWQDWHRYRIEWTEEFVRYFIDDIQVGNVTDKAHIPDTLFKYHQQGGTHESLNPPNESDGDEIQTAWVVWDAQQE